MRVRNLHAVFYPSSIAVVGATNTPGTVPNDIFTNIMRSGFPGPIYPVSPGHATISGAKAYKYVIDIPHPVDLAVIVFPSTVCPLALEQCGQKGIKAAIVISAGFKEMGPKGKLLEDRMKEIAARYDIAMVGPNCLGVINTDPAVQLNASFARKMPVEGAIGFLSQSGALCTAVLDYALNKHIGFSKFVSFGNKADIDEVDLLRYLLSDEKTKTILLYVEEIALGNKYKLPVFIEDYPAEIKSFYMKRYTDDGGVLRARNADLIAPEEGREIIGGSQREEGYDMLKQEIIDRGYSLAEYEWYLNTRKYGSVPHSGFGIGLERTVRWITGVHHIRETIAFPRMLNRSTP